MQLCKGLDRFRSALQTKTAEFRTPYARLCTSPRSILWEFRGHDTEFWRIRVMSPEFQITDGFIDGEMKDVGHVGGSPIKFGVLRGTEGAVQNYSKRH